MKRAHAMVACLFGLIASITLSAPAPAQQNPLVGEWRGIVHNPNGAVLDVLYLLPNGDFVERGTNEQGQMIMKGSYHLNGAQLVLQVEDWEPKGAGGYISPPMAVYMITMLSANTIVLRNDMYGIETRYDRVR